MLARSCTRTENTYGFCDRDCGSYLVTFLQNVCGSTPQVVSTDSGIEAGYGEWVVEPVSWCVGKSGHLFRCSMISLLKQIREDLSSHGSDWTRPGFQALAVHRFGNWERSLSSKVLRAPFHALAQVGHVLCRNVYGIELPFSAKIGRRVVFEHQGSIIIHGSSKIGDGCIIRQNTTIGMKDMSDPFGAPCLGNNVNVGCSCSLLGPIEIGNDVIIGANSVVVKNVKSNTTVVGIPAKTVAYR